MCEFAIAGTPFREAFAFFSPFLVELSRGVERARKPLMLSICAYTILLGSERPTLKACPSQFLLAQCREIVDIANSTGGWVGERGAPE